MITQRAVLVGFIGFCFYLIALVNGLPSYFYVLTWLSLSILVSSAGLALLSIAGIDCTWRITQKIGSEHLEGENVLSPAASQQERGKVTSAPTLEFDLANQGTLNKTGVVIEVRLRHAAHGADVHRAFLLESLPSGSALTTVVSLGGLSRGRYVVNSVRVIGSDVLGLFRVWRNFTTPRGGATDAQVGSNLAGLARRRAQRVISESNDAAELLIGPATVGVRSRSGEGSSVAAGSEASSSDLVGRSDEMRGIRPYHAGDDLRTVHWKSTARLGRLVVREFDRMARPECVVIWDGGQNWGDERILNEILGFGSPVELGLRAAASLVRGLTEAGRPCALLRLDGAPVWIDSQKRIVGGVQLARSIETLAAADVGRKTPLAVALGEFTKRLSESSEVFVVTSAHSSELEYAIAALQRLGVRVTIAQLDTAQWPATFELAKSAPGGFATRWRLRQREKRLLRNFANGTGTLAKSFDKGHHYGATVCRIDLPAHSEAHHAGCLRSAIHGLLARGAGNRPTITNRPAGLAEVTAAP